MGKIVKFNNNLEYYLKLFDTRKKDGDLLGALDAGRSAIKNAKTHIDKQSINILLGEIFFDMKLYSLSCEHFFRAVKIPMTRASAYFGIAKNLVLLNKNLLALDYLDEVLEWDYFGNFTESVLEWTKTIKETETKNENNIKLKLKKNIINIINIGKYDDAINYLQQIIPLYVQDTDFCLLLAKSYILKQDYNSAKNVLFDIVHNTKNVKAYILLAKMFINLQDYNATNEYLEIIKNSTDLSDNDLFSVALLYFEIDNYDNAIQYFNEILKRNEYKPKILLYIAICYYNLHDYENSLFFVAKARWIDYENVTLVQFYDLFKNQAYDKKINLTIFLPKDIETQKFTFVYDFLQQNDFANVYLKNDIDDDLQWGLTLNNNSYDELFSQQITMIKNKKAKNLVYKNLISTRPTLKQKYYLTKYAIQSGNYKYIDLTANLRFHSFSAKMNRALFNNDLVRRSISNARAYVECFAMNININNDMYRISKLIINSKEKIDIDESTLTCVYFYQKSQIFYDACSYFNVDIKKVTTALQQLGLG